MPLQRDISHWADWPDSDLIDQAAGACQSRLLLENEMIREAIALNVIAPFRQRLAKLNGEHQTRDSGPKPDGRDREDGLGAKPEGHGARQRNRPTLPSQTPAEESNND